MGVKAVKVASIDTDGFTKTIEYEVLHQSHVGVNHNKFYCLEIQCNPKKKKYRLFSHYGRLGKTNVYDVRGPIDTEEEAKKEFDSILKKKKRGKKVTRKDGSTEKEQYVKVDTVMPSVGSDNIRSKKASVTVKTVDHIDSTAYNDPLVSKVIDLITDENIHNITSKTTLKLTVNGFETPLGPITKEHVTRAKIPLMEIKSAFVDGRTPPTKEVERANSEFYSLIPHSFGHKITEDDWILDDVKLLSEFDLLEQLETAVSMGSAMSKSATQRMKALGTEVKLLKDKKEFNRIARKFKNSRADNHRGTNVWDYKIKNIFTLKIPDERKRFELRGAKLGNRRELFHGSKNCNILSILKNGLIIPPCNASHVTGRMFGPGIYGAHNSTKALNYSIGFWSSKRNRYNSSFLFLTDFAMGKEYEAYSQMYDGAPKGYDSVHAKSGRGLCNDEYIVYNTHQSTLSYLCELEK